MRPRKGRRDFGSFCDKRYIPSGDKNCIEEIGESISSFQLERFWAIAGRMLAVLFMAVVARGAVVEFAETVVQMAFVSESPFQRDFVNAQTGGGQV